MWDLIFPTSNQTLVLEDLSLYHWTTMEILVLAFVSTLKKILKGKKNRLSLTIVISLTLTFVSKWQTSIYQCCIIVLISFEESYFFY